MLRRFVTRTVYPLLRPRWLSAQSENTDGEKKIQDVLRVKFPNATEISVEDVSGGCGAMYQIHIESQDFHGKRLVAQHRMVTNALESEIKEMHGLRISTAIPADAAKT